MREGVGSNVDRLEFSFKNQLFLKEKKKELERKELEKYSKIKFYRVNFEYKYFNH